MVQAVKLPLWTPVSHFRVPGVEFHLSFRLPANVQLGQGWRREGSG